MKFKIKHKITDAVVFEAELLAEFKTETARVQLGAAIKLAFESGANLSDANLSGANLAYANLSDANLSDANLSYANLSYANLSDANLAYANLSDANLSGANLASANLASANLASANLADANLSDANYIDLGFNERGHRFGLENNNGKIVFIGGCRRWHSIEDARNHYASTSPTSSDKACALARLNAGYEMAVARGWIK